MTRETDPFDIVRAEEMLCGYSARWYDEPLEILAVEREFDGPFINPATGAESRTFRLGGKIDAIVRDLRVNRVRNVEHKTSSEDITQGSDYWKRLKMNSQVSTYMVGARELGYDPVDTLFDVLGKPGQRPSQAPLVDENGVKIVFDATGQRVKTKDGKKWRESASSADGYVLQSRPETLDEYRERVRGAIIVDPDRYYRRGDVVRLVDEERDAAYDAWQTGTNIREGRNMQRWPRNPDSCVGYGSTCGFFAVCTGEASLDDPTRYVKRPALHSELSADVSATRRLPLITNSEMSAYRRCTRLHHNRYDLGYESVSDSEAQRFGTLVHVGLEQWWLARAVDDSHETCVERAVLAMRAPVVRVQRPGLAKAMGAEEAKEIVL